MTIAVDFDGTCVTHDFQRMKISDDIECGLCHGEGTLEEDYWHKGKQYTAEFDCPVCEGSGHEEEGKYVNTGNKTFDKLSIVVFKGQQYDMNLFYKLIQVQKIIQSEIILTVKPSADIAAMFRIGDFEILMMPTSTDIEGRKNLTIE